jgi:hypothetical protein
MASVVMDVINFVYKVVDRIDFATGGVPVVSTSQVTTGLEPWVVGSVKRPTLSAALDGLPWNTAGGTATIYFLSPLGVATNFAAAVDANGAHYDWTVVAPAGLWTRCWKVVDAAGLVQYSPPIAFAVTVSP